jgi:nitrate/TMAO reductase-like tetraheme cytochrome c subunit
MSKLAIGLLTAAAVLVAGLAFASYRFYRYIEYDPSFCGSCHLMEQAWKTWQAGPHHTVNCHTCHQQDIGDRLRIVWRWATQDVHDVPPHTRLARRVCEDCHVSQDARWAQIAETAGHNIHVTRADLDCLSCHLPSLHAVAPQAEACQTCHTAARMNIGGMVAFHCTTCHNFLAKGDQGIFPEPAACLACHATMQVKGETFPAGGPMAFPCADCHKPHSKPFLQFQDCLSCHTSVLEDRAHFERRALTGCIQCHKPHTWSAAQWP